MSLFHKRRLPPLPAPPGLPAGLLPPLPPAPPSPRTVQEDEFMDETDEDLDLPVEPKKGRAKLDMPRPPVPPRLKMPPETASEKLAEDFQPGVSEKGTYPPIFIKIDRYRELIEEIERLKLSAVSLRDAVDALSEMAKELNSGISITQRALDKFNKVVTGIDAKMLKSGGPVGEHPVSSAEIDSYVRNLYQQVENIKKDLRTVQ